MHRCEALPVARVRNWTDGKSVATGPRGSRDRGAAASRL